MKRLVLFWLASLVMVAVVASTFTLAQTQPNDDRIVSGDDIGFRVEGTDGSGNPTGTLMIRLNGEWTQVASAPGLRLLQNWFEELRRLVANVSVVDRALIQIASECRPGISDSTACQMRSRRTNRPTGRIRTEVSP